MASSTRPTFIITATGTGVGKTVVSAMLALGLEASYYKPVQAGGPPTDSQRVAALTGLPPLRLLPECYRLARPLSPHQAAAEEGLLLDVERLARLPSPSHPGPLLVEGAGGLLVPLTPGVLQVELFARWGAPLVLVAPTGLGAINQTLLSLEAVRARGLPLLGLVFVGPARPESQAAICRFGQVRQLGRLPRLRRLTPQTLQNAFEAHFHLQDFLP